MKWFILLSCLSWYHWFAIGLVEFLFVSSSTVIVLLFFSLFFLLILDRTCFGVLSGVSSDELVKLSDEFSDFSSLPSVYKVSYLFWQFIGLFSIFLEIAIFSMFNYLKFFSWHLIIARFILTFNKHFENCSFWFVFFYQKFNVFLKKFYNFFIVLLFRMNWNAGNAVFNNIEKTIW